jgi:peptide/nickel transport system permease protein/oligopeptide transport system permease protein
MPGLIRAFACMIKPPPALTPARRALRRFLGNKAACAGAAWLMCVVLLLVVWPHVRKFGPDQITAGPSEPPSGAHLFGTDVHGRDLFSRVVYGTQVSMLVGLSGALVSLVIGVLWGSIAGYVGGRLDATLMRTVDVLYSLPTVIFVVVLLTTVEGFARTKLKWLYVSMGDSSVRFLLLFIGLGAVSWLTMARIVRGEVLSLKRRTYVEASLVLGASHARVLFRHILPNLAGVVIIYMTLTVPAIVIYESFLSFLGLGIQPPQASLGSLLAEGVAQINPIRIYWWMVVFPGLGLVATLLGLNLLGDGLRDALDPKASS